MSTYEFYLYGHLLGVFLLLGAAGLSTGTGVAIARTDSARVVVMLFKIMRASEFYVTTTGSVLVVIFGLLLVDEAGYSMGDAWISAALTLLIVVLAIDHGFLMPRAKKGLRMAEALGDGPVSPELSAHLNNPLTIAAGVALDISFLVFLYLMVAKPGA
jgi:uncharacterized membrane protein